MSMSKAVLNISQPAYRKLCKKILGQQTETNNTKIKTKEFWNASPFPLQISSKELLAF